MQRKHGNGDKHRRFRAYTLKPNTEQNIMRNIKDNHNQSTKAIKAKIQG